MLAVPILKWMADTNIMILTFFEHTVTISRVLFHDGTLLHSKLNTQPLIAVHNASRILTQV
jgi:hypothetical protein